MNKYMSSSAVLLQVGLESISRVNYWLNIQFCSDAAEETRVILQCLMNSYMSSSVVLLRVGLKLNDRAALLVIYPVL